MWNYLKQLVFTVQLFLKNYSSDTTQCLCSAKSFPLSKPRREFKYRAIFRPTCTHVGINPFRSVARSPGSERSAPGMDDLIRNSWCSLQMADYFDTNTILVSLAGGRCGVLGTARYGTARYGSARHGTGNALHRKSSLHRRSDVVRRRQPHST